MERRIIFGNEPDWGPWFWTAAASFMVAYSLLRGVGLGLGELGSSTAKGIGAFLILLSAPVGAALGETLYRWRVGLSTRGLQRALLCLLGPLLLFLGGGVFGFGWNVGGYIRAACFAGGWLFLLDRFRDGDA